MCCQRLFASHHMTSQSHLAPVTDNHALGSCDIALFHHKAPTRPVRGSSRVGRGVGQLPSWDSHYTQTSSRSQSARTQKLQLAVIMPGATSLVPFRAWKSYQRNVQSEPPVPEFLIPASAVLLTHPCMCASCRGINIKAPTDRGGSAGASRLLFVQVALSSRGAFEASATAGDIRAAAFSGATGINPGQGGGEGGWGVSR